MIRLYTALMAILPVGRIGQAMRTWVVRVLAGLLVDKSFRDCFNSDHLTQLHQRSISDGWEFLVYPIGKEGSAGCLYIAELCHFCKPRHLDRFERELEQ